MMKTYITISFLFIQLSFLWGQTSPRELSAKPEKTAGVYYAYPGDEAEAPTVPPKGYEPFYISHFGRHGSRYLISDRDYKWVHDLFEKANTKNALTPLGTDVYLRLKEVWAEAEGRSSSLSPLGVSQQRNIAERMFTNYKSLFSGGLPITAVSTLVPRCILSMDAFCERLKELNPALNISRESNDRHMRYLDYYTDEARAFKSGDSWREQYRKFEQSHVRGDRLTGLLFSDEVFVLKQVNPKSVMWALFSIAGNMQNMQSDVSFYDLFEGSELFDLWQCGNYNNYVISGNSAINGGIMAASAMPNLKNMLESAEKVIVSGDKGVSLRFAHDGNLIPLTLLMQLEGCTESISVPADFYKVWSNFKVSPMAANIQLIFFRKKGTDDILVKFLHNEKQVRIRSLESDIFPFYHWQDVRRFYNKVIAENTVEK